MRREREGKGGGEKQRKEKGKKERGRVYIGKRGVEFRSKISLSVNSLYNAAVVLLCLIPSLLSVSLGTRLRNNYLTCKPNSLSNR